jgi:hypothetical protein
MIKEGMRVKTIHGPGTVIHIERICDKHPRAGVKHDKQPERFTDKILYYFMDEVKKLNGKL